MAYRIAGRTIARYGNEHRTQTLAGATLVFYPQTTQASEPASTKWGWYPLETMPEGELGRTVVREDGSYEVNLENYQGGPLNVALEVSRFSYAPDTGMMAMGLLGTGQPMLQENGEDVEIAVLDIDLSSSIYCQILVALDLWVVSGRVTDCAEQPVPLVGANVTVFDRDLTQDDNLGTGVTDASGSFEIFFAGPTFRQIPALSPPFDLIPPLELIGGPDVFFRIERAGIMLLDEPASQGRATGRENRTNCSYFELCIQAPPWTPQTLTLWSYIGNYQVPDSGSMHDFDADGFVANGKLAFFSAIDLNGQLSQTFLGEPVSFRYVIAEWTNLAMAPNYPADYSPVTGTQIVNAPYGALYTPTDGNPWDFTLTPVLPAPDAQGWIAVDQSPNFVRNTSRLIMLDTTALVPVVSHAQGPTDAGLQVPNVERDRPRKFSLILEVRTASYAFAQLTPVTIHINNSNIFLRYDLAELMSDACDPLMELAGAVTLTPRFTAAHPYLRGYSIGVQRQGGAVKTLRTDDFSAHTPLWTDPQGEFGSFSDTYEDVLPCSYRTWITASRRVTNGYGGPGSEDILRTFCVG